MGRSLVLAGCLVLAILTCLGGAAAVTEYVVGDSRGWTASPNITAGYYDEWAAGKTFAEGDTLKFVLNGTHNLAVVSKEVYDTCGNTTLVFNSEGSDVLYYSLGEYGNENGQYHFISTIDSDCENGQKLAITIKSSDSSASSIAVGDLSMLVLVLSSIIAMFMN